jgi:4-amino-4-deoxy-L-arabinose transferase-like glycosyltransferase
MPRSRPGPRARSKAVANSRSSSAAGTSKRWSASLAILVVAAFAIKLIVMLQLQDHPLLQPDAGLDSTTYVQLARRVLNGDLSLGPGLYYVSPLYIYFLSAALAIADSFSWVRTLQIGLGALAVGCVFVTTEAWFSRRAAWIAAALVTLTGVITFYEVLVLQASLDVFLTAAGLMALTFALRRGGQAWPIAAGVLFALEGLNRPNALVAIVALIVAFAIARKPKPAVWLLAGLVAGLAPVVLRNAVVSHQFALASSQGGLNFYIGNHAGATGQYVAVPGVRADIEGQSEDTRRIAEQAVGHPLSDAGVSSYFSGLAWRWIRDEPRAAVRLFVRKLALVFNAQFQWLDFSYPYYAHDVGSWLGALFVGPWLLVPLGLVGLAIPFWSEKPGYAAWAVFVPAYAVGVAVFFVAERYRMPMFVPLAIGAGAAIDSAATALSERRLRSLVAPGVAVILLATAANWPFKLDDGRFAERLRLAKVLMNKGDFHSAVDELTKAHDIDPQQTTAEFVLGIALVSDGRPGEGISHMQHAIAAGVPINGARYTLVRAIQASGDSARAAALLRTYQPEPGDDGESCVQVAILALSVDAVDVADTFARTAIERGNSSARAFGTLAYCEARLGRLNEARSLVERTLQIDPTYDVSATRAIIGGK